MGKADLIGFFFNWSGRENIFWRKLEKNCLLNNKIETILNNEIFVTLKEMTN